MAAYGRLVHFMRTGRFPRDPWWTVPAGVALGVGLPLAILGVLYATGALP
jgi:hypothetical protein